MKTIVIIVAAGRSKRMRDNFVIPKQYLPLGKSNVLRESILKFQKNPNISNIICVINENDIDLYNESIFDLDLLNPVIGGDSRHESIYNGLKAIKEFSPENVIIHDANRPFIDKKIINGIVKQLEYCDAVIPAIKEDESVKISKSGNIVEQAIDRNNVWKIQTPEGYKYEVLCQLYQNQDGNFDYDIPSMHEKAGLPVTIIPGSKHNFKIMDKEDYKKAQDIYSLQEKTCGEIRIGSALRFYNLKDSQSNLKICDIEVPLKKTLDTTDDVVFETIGDALMGSIGAGCTYCHNKKKGEHKKLLADKIMRLLNRKSTIINNMDITITCDNLDICKYKKPIAKSIAKNLNINENRVNIKGTNVNMLPTSIFANSDHFMISVMVCIKIIN